MADSGLSVSRGRVRAVAEDYGLLVVAGAFVLVGAAGIALYFVGDRALAERLIADYGLYALAGIFVLEGAMLLYFAPSEAIVPVALQAMAATEGGYHVPTAVAIFAVAVAFATAGQTLLFLLARRGGREWLLEKPWFRVSEDRLDRFDDWFLRWGRPAVPLSNAFLFTRGMLTVPAGVSDMDVREFVVLSAVGTAVFEGWLALAAHYAIAFGLFDFL
jgi:membrane protein DedA with SNARE-associated domain